MILKNQNILIISPEKWGVNYVSKHHIALHLAKRGNNVYFLNPPSKNFKVNKINENLTIVDYSTSIRGLRFLPLLFTKFFFQFEINRLQRLIKSNLDIIWNFDSSRFYDLSKLNRQLKIAHMVDYHENFHRKQICLTYNLCLCTTEFIKQEMKVWNSNSFNIGHGYALPEANEKESVVDLSFKHKINVAYLGNLAIKFIDWSIILQIVESNKDVGFYFIGPYEKSNISNSSLNSDIYEKFKSQSNCFFVGPIKSNQIYSYLSKFDILLLIYKAASNLKQLANPHKVLEYLGTGKVVLSSYTEEYKNQIGLLEMSDQNENLPKIFKRITKDLNTYNSASLQQQRINFAYSKSYDQQLLKIQELIGELKL